MNAVDLYGDYFWQEMDRSRKPMEERKGEMDLEEIKDAINALAHKDRLDDEDRVKMSDLKHQLERWKWNRKEEEAKIKNPYFEMAMLVNRLIRPNGRWNTNIKVWDDIRNEVVDFILKKKIEKEGENG